MSAMLLQSLPFRSSSSTLLVEPHDLHSSRSSSSLSSSSSSSSSKAGVNSRLCFSSSSRDYSHIPKRNQFRKREWWERVLKDPPLIERTLNKLGDYCCKLEGDECYKCWETYLDLCYLEREAPKEEVERLINGRGAAEYLVGFLHGFAEIYKAKKAGIKSENASNLEQAKPQKSSNLEQVKTQKSSKLEQERESLCPIPDGLPKSWEEIEEEEKARMADSPHTRLLRAIGRKSHPPAPDFLYG